MLKSPRMPEPDGRRERSEASRERIVRAMLELVGEGDVSPAAEVVAARAKVGLRTVFRHFENMESLYRQIDALIVAEVRPIATEPFKSRDWRARFDEMIERRARIFERIMPYKTAGEVHRHHSSFIAAQSALFTRELRSALTKILPATLSRDRDLFEAIDMLLSFECWRRLRKEQGLSVPRARAVLLRVAREILPNR